MNIFATLLGFIPRKTIVVVSTMLPLLLLVLIATSQLVAATPYSDGYSHGCDDGKVGFHKYLNTAGKGIDFHTTEFMQGYDTGYKACFSPSGSARTSEIHSQSSSDSDTGGTLVSCNKSQHTLEYCNGYRAGAVQADVDDDPDENIIPSKVTCQGGSPGSEYCRGYQQGYAGEDHAMFSPPDR
jgi:hypothetical protein